MLIQFHTNYLMLPPLITLCLASINRIIVTLIPNGLFPAVIYS